MKFKRLKKYKNNNPKFSKDLSELKMCSCAILKTAIDKITRLTRLSLSLGGSWGSKGEVFAGKGEDALGFSLAGISPLGICLSIFSTAGVGGGVCVGGDGG